MPRTILPNARVQPRYAGICTFGRFPLLDAVPDECRPVDWAIVGAPFDNGVTYRNGARFGPRAIRNESQYLKPYHLVHDVSIVEVLSLADAGDAPVMQYACQANAEAVSGFIQSLPDPDVTRAFMLGGDHSNTLAALRAAHRRAGSPAGGLALIHFDAHLDTVDQLLGERYTHASPFIRAIEEGVLDPRATLSVGIRGPLNTRDDLSYAKDKGITLVTMDRLAREGTAPIERFIAGLGDRPCYLTFDIDCLDPVYAPGTGTPCPGGLTTTQAFDLLRLLGQMDGGRGPVLAGADVVEVLPDRDPLGGTALLAAHVAFEILALDARRAAMQAR
jgi:agmatinase